MYATMKYSYSFMIYVTGTVARGILPPTVYICLQIISVFYICFGARIPQPINTHPIPYQVHSVQTRHLHTLRPPQP